MTTFDDREQAFERKFAHDAELQFKAEARRNKLLAAWAAKQLGLSGEEAEAYATEVIMADLKEAGDDDVFRKVTADFEKRGVALEPSVLRAKMDEFFLEAKAQLAKG